MYIEPNTVVRLLNDIKLNNKYTDTINFGTINAQTSYFSEKTKHTLERNTYQRVNNGVFRCGLNADLCYDCTYMMFQNTNYGNKWFYAFITKVEYVNNNMCNIYFELDTLQSYWFDFEFNQCFIEREHVSDDSIGNYTLEENVNTSSEWQKVDEGFLNLSDLLYADVYTKETIELEDLQVINGVLCGLPIHTNQTSGAEKDTIQHYVNTGDENKLIDIYSYPKTNINVLSVALNYTLNGGYTPKNNKLYTAQFNKCVLTDLQANSTNLYYERSSNENHNIAINIDKAIVPTPIIQATPINYNSYSNDYSSSLTIKEFPKVIWSGNAYQQWLAYNSMKNNLAMVGTTVQAVAGVAGGSLSAGMGTAMVGAGVASGNPLLAMSGATQIAAGTITAGTSIANGVVNQASILNERTVQKHNGNKVYGSADSCNLLIGKRAFGIYLIQVSQPKEYLEMADCYFEMFGYKVNRIKTIDYNNRPFWNYVKTCGCTINGRLPADVSTIICSIMDNGIRFWHNGDNIGNYNLNNH